MRYVAAMLVPCYGRHLLFVSFQNFLGLGQSASIEIALDNLTNRKVVEIKTDQQQSCLLPIFYSGESFSGKVTISLKRGNKLEYQGIKIELIGHIDFFADRGSRDEFLNRTQDLARPGILSQASTTYPFRFDNVDLPFESYSGSNVQLRYVSVFSLLLFGLVHLFASPDWSVLHWILWCASAQLSV